MLDMRGYELLYCEEGVLTFTNAYRPRVEEAELKEKETVIYGGIQ
jgi:hypothetical protein